MPFTPVTGPRLLARPGPLAEAVRGALARCAGRDHHRQRAVLGPCHLPDRGGMARARRARLPATHRPAIPLGECRLRDASTISWAASPRASARPSAASARTRLPPASRCVWLTGSDLTEAIWDAFFAFYMDTGSRKWGRPYLTREFFSIVGETMRDRILLVMAKRAGPLDRRRHQLHRRRHALWPQLGRDRAPSVSAFRALLLSGHRLRDRPQAQTGRGRRPGRAQAGARLPAAHHLFRPFHRQSGLAPGGRRVSGARTRLCTGGRRGACGGRAIPQGFGRARLS